MAPVKKQKESKLRKSNSKQKKVENVDETVISGQLQKKINKKQSKLQKIPKGVVFIKHLPHGFFEEQLKKYFEQFGDVTRVRLGRSRRTGNSKGYAFVEFKYPEVAEVAAETMDNYLMFKKVVKASYIPPEKQQFNYFRSSVKKIRNKSGKFVWVSKKTLSIHRKMKKHNDWSEENYQKRTKKQLQKLKKMEEKYAHLGIDLNEIIVQPKILTEKEKKKQEQSTLDAFEKENPVAISMRKTMKTSYNKQQNLKKSSKNKLTLEDLLGNTIPEDSEDDDYIAMDHYGEQSEVSSDEETYGFTKDSESEEYKEQEKSENKIYEDPSPIVKKKLKKDLGKTVKSSLELDRFDKMLKRKPHTGGINKLNKKPMKKTSVAAKKKTALQITAAMEMAIPLTKVKGKLRRTFKCKQNIKKVK